MPCRPPNQTLFDCPTNTRLYNSHIKNTFSAGLMYRRLQGVVSSEYYDSGSKSESLTAILCKVYIPLRHVSIRGLPRPSKYPVKGGEKKLLQCSTYRVHGPSRNAFSLRKLNDCCCREVTTNNDRRLTLACITT
jgi:hypothetical protein